MLKSLYSRLIYGSYMEKRQKYIVGSDISAVSITFRDAPNHTVREIIEDSRAAYRLNERMEKNKSKWRIF